MLDLAARRRIELEAAEALLSVGVSVPLMALRLPLIRRPLVVRLTMRRPTLGSMIEIARCYLRLGVAPDQLETMTKEAQMAFLADHGKDVSRMIALTLGRRSLVGPLAWVIRRWMSRDYQIAALSRFVSLIGTDPFLTIIRSADRINPMRPRLSREKRGS